jgi:hypothetical protein
MKSPTPTNVSALLGCLGIAQPMIYVPTKDRHGHRYATWDKVTHSAEDKEGAYNIAWMLAGIPADGEENVGYREEGHAFKVETSQYAWMVCLRAATLFNAIHDEAHWSA